MENQKSTGTELLLNGSSLLLCITLPACAFLMIGPQIMVIAPLSLVGNLLCFPSYLWSASATRCYGLVLLMLVIMK